MKKMLFLGFMLFSLAFSAQKSSEKSFLICNDALISGSLLDRFTKSIEKMQVYNLDKVPAQYKKYSSLFKDKVLVLSMKKNFPVMDKMPLSELNLQNELPENQLVLIDDIEIADPSIVIYTDIVNNLKVVDYKGNKTLQLFTNNK